MTKLVDVQGLKPCPMRGSGSSPDTGSYSSSAYYNSCAQYDQAP
jgi:hypothetical protein